MSYVEKDYWVTVTLEVNAFADPEPYQQMDISSYVADFMCSTGNEDQSTNNSLSPII